MAGQTNRRRVNLFLAVFLGVLAVDVFVPLNESDEALKDPINTSLVFTGLWQGFHLSIESSMNLFLFHWLMILGLVSFAEFDELRWPPWRRSAAAPS